MKQIELLKLGKNKLKQSNIQDAHIKSNILLQYVLNQTKQQLVVKSFENVSEQNKQEYLKWIDEVINGMPVQYITHNQQFMGLDFYVDENVLIPQPDTESLVEEAIKVIEQVEAENIEVLDLCTGSGAIAISIAHYNKKAKIAASDISKQSLEIAKKNAINNKVEIEFIESDLFEKIQNRKFNIIVSNPPYIKSQVISTLDKEVQKEPYIALDGGKDGLVFYKEILKNVSNYLKKEGYILLEIGYDQENEVINLAKENNELKIITEKAIKDFGGNNRVLIFQKKQ